VIDRIPHSSGVATVLAVAALALTAAGARADVVLPDTWDHLTLETWDGWRYYDITLVPSDDGRGVLVSRSDGSQRFFVWEELRTVWTEGGTDITDRILPPDALLYQPDGPPDWAQPREPLRDRPPDVPLREPRFRQSFGAAAGYGLALGDWFTGLEDGASFGFQARSAVARYFYLTGLYRDQRLAVSGFMPNYPGGYQVFSGHGNLRQFGLGFGVMPGRDYYDQVVPYLELMLGGVSHDLTYDERGDVGDYVETLNDDQFGVIVQFGMLWPVVPWAAVEVSGHWLYTGASDWAYGSVLGLQGGVTFLFGP